MYSKTCIFYGSVLSIICVIILIYRLENQMTVFQGVISYAAFAVGNSAHSNVHGHVGGGNARTDGDYTTRRKVHVQTGFVNSQMPTELLRSRTHKQTSGVAVVTNRTENDTATKPEELDVHNNTNDTSSMFFYVAAFHTDPVSVCNQTFYNSHFMTAWFAGRTGNLLFQYATLLATARRYCYTPYTNKNLMRIDSTFAHVYTSNVFNGSLANNTRRLGDKGSGVYNSDVEHLNTTTNWTIPGYRESWKYLLHSEKLIRSMLTFKDEIQRDVSAFLQDVVRRRGTKNVTTVSVHVRRTDMATPRLQKKGFGVANVSYLRNAMTHFRNILNFAEPVFIFVSDDITWCKQSMDGPDVIFSPFQSVSLDLALIATCDHVIITSGTFGWWGAWLNGGNVVYYSGYPIPGSPLGGRINRTDYYPPHWIGMR